MGNCLASKTEKGSADTPRKNSNKNTDPDGEAPKQLVQDNEKPKQDQDDGTSQKDRNQEIKRVKKNLGKIKKGQEKYQPDVLYENVKRINHDLKSNDINFLINTLKSSFVFYNLSPDDLENIVSKMFYCEAEANEYIFKQGDDASSFFIIEKGAVDVIINNKNVKTMKSRDSFGELALLYNAPRSATIKAREKTVMWGIDRQTFRSAIEELTIKEFEENRQFIEAVTFFQSMTPAQKDSIANVLIGLKFSPGQTIVNQGDQADSFYLIKEGTVQVLVDGKELRQMVKGESFGEQALYNNTTRGATVKAIDSVKILSLGREKAQSALGNQIQKITYKNLQKWAFEKDHLLQKLTKLQIERFVETEKFANFKQGQVLAAKGTRCSKQLFIVDEGEISKVKLKGGKKGGKVIAKKGEMYGSDFLQKEYQNKTFDDDVIAAKDSVITIFDQEIIHKIIGKSLEEALQKAENSHEKKMMNQTSELKQLANKIDLRDLINYKKLGFGQFGSVYLVRHPQYNHFFALKCVSKQQVVEQSLEKHLQQEKSVLEVVNFPFIMQFIRTYKDANYIYFLIEYVKGMELFDVIREIGLLNTSDSQFYIGSMILAIEYLHTQNIIYRDIKPENIMIDSKGYLKMIDMGTAKFLKGKGAGAKRTFTIIGTPHYMAPEIITGKGYTLAVDLWSIGICLYEFMCGMVPFGEEADDPYEIYEDIITKPIKYPGYLKDKKAKRLMDQLLNKVAEVRLGGSFAALKANPWFDTFDWDKLLDKELSPPYKPPKSKLISDGDIKKAEKEARKVFQVIEEEHKSNPKKYKKESASDPNWDKNF